MFSVNQYFSGHGLGKELHLWPIIGYARGDGSNVVLKSGMVFTVEPIIMELGHEHYVKEDGWTAVSKDGGRCAQHEEAILVTDQGPVVLTSH
jgi:methionyl aminopeptidase